MNKNNLYLHDITGDPLLFLTISEIGDNIEGLVFLDDSGIQYTARCYRSPYYTSSLGDHAFIKIYTFIRLDDMENVNLLKILCDNIKYLNVPEVALALSKCSADEFNDRYDIMNNYTEYKPREK